MKYAAGDTCSRTKPVRGERYRSQAGLFHALAWQTIAPPQHGSGEGHGTAAGARCHSLRNALRDDLTMAGLDEGTVVPVQRPTSWLVECVCSDTDSAARFR